MKKTIQDAEKATAKLAAEVVEEAPKVVKKAAKAAEKTAEKTAKTAKAATKTATKTVKEAAKKAESASAEAKKAVTEAASMAAIKKGVKETVYLQYFGKEINKDDIMKKVKDVWTKDLNRKVGEMSTVTLYLKPEDNMAYYVVNGDVTGSVSLD